MPEILIPELETPFSFHRQPVAIPADMRPGWRIAVLLLLLRVCCRRNRSTFGRVHVLSWAARTAVSRADLLRVLDGGNTLDSLLVRIEPAVNRAVDLAFGGGLLRHDSGERIELTEAGVTAANRLREAGGIFSVEKQFFDDVGSRLTEDLVKRLFTMTGRR